MKKYNPKSIESKWQRQWKENGIYKTTEQEDKPKCYVLDMFPYPSGEGLHVGHPKGYIATDVYSRFKKMNGFNVLHPMGWDAFGLPAENYAIKNKVHPRVAVEKNIARFKEQLLKIGFNYDWEREINTTDSEFYKWTQWTFLQMFKKGLAYESYEPINWCPSCKTGLANEDLDGDKCERCGTIVEKKPMRQWVLKITEYADRMLKDLDELNWPESIKQSQRNWIGRSFGSSISFKIQTNAQKNADQTQKVAETKNDDFLYKDLTYKIRGVFFEVNKNIGLGHKEDIYHKALEIEFEKVGLKFKSKKNIDIKYDGKKIGTYQPDFIVEDKVLIELKAVPEIGKPQLNQVWTYLKGCEYKLALLVNFGTKSLDIKRIVYDTARADCCSAFSASSLRNSATSIEVFTTRPDTLYGATYCVLAPEHKLVDELKEQIENWDEVVRYIVQSREKTEIERTAVVKDKTGVELKGVKAINPANNEEIPIFIADYVLVNYGTGAIMAVPAHDERDFEFAKKFGLPVRQVILKNSAPVKSYIMGVEEIDEFKKIGVEILEKTKDGEFKVIIPKEVLNNYEKIIEQKMEPGFWNEYVGEKTVFMFKHKDGKFERIVLSVDTEEYIDKLAAKFMSEEHWKKSSVWKWLAENDWYTDVIIHTENGKVINSGKFDGMDSEEAKTAITEFVGGKMKTTYKLRDWVFSRQRYWGEPIPVIHCEKCGTVPVPEKDLPVLLPEVESYEPTGTGESPLAGIDEWVNVDCPKCDGAGKRETNTMPQWAGSSWYYLRYIDPKNKEALVDKEKEKYWSPVDMYVGGAEHATRHLIYARFWHKFLYDIGVVNYKEPFSRLQHVGLIAAEDGRKMSKRYGNVTNPDDIVATYGADTLRLYEMFMGPFDQGVQWSTDGIIGPRRFIEKAWRFQEKVSKENDGVNDGINAIEATLHKTIKKVGSDIEEFGFNTAIAQMMILGNELDKADKIERGQYETFLKILAPFVPHVAEELWHRLGNKTSVHLEEWPKYDEAKTVDDTVTIAVQVNGKVRGTLEITSDTPEEEVKKRALESDMAKKWIGDSSVEKIVYVSGRLISIVTKG